MHRLSLDKSTNFMLASRFNKANLELCDGNFNAFSAKPHKWSALRLNTWL